MKPRPHADLIKAWADGAQIQCKEGTIQEWSDIEHPNWFQDAEYRINPKWKDDLILKELK